MWEGKLHFLSFIPQPSSFRKVPGWSVTYYYRSCSKCNMVQGFRGTEMLDPRRDLA
jgi:hypothetical protein